MGGAAIGEPAERPRSRPPASYVSGLLLGLVGFLVGRELAYQQSVGGEPGIFGAATIFFAVLLATVLGSVAWLVLAPPRIGRRAALRLLTAALGALVVAAIAGNVTARFTGGIYHRPVQLHSDGATTSSISPDGGAPIIGASGTAVCLSVPDATSVGSIDVLDLGKVEGATLRGSIGLETATDPLSIDLFVDAANFAPDEAIPPWSGTGTLVDSGADALDGRVEFDLTLAPFDPKLPAPTRPWPERLSGSIDWACDPLAAAQADQ